MRSESKSTPPKPLKVKEMFTRVMTVAELLSKSSENHEPKHRPYSQILQKTQK
jgi:hypothetical protein